MLPLLSIVIANYNYGRFLEEAIQSVIKQEKSELVELIICDAASTDNSVDIITKYANGLPPNTLRSNWEGSELQTSNFKLQTPNSQTPNSSTPPLPHSSTPPLITWWCSEPDGGQSAAFNKGFSHARGRFLTWLNADDVLLPGTVAALARAAERWLDCEWFVGGCFWLDPEMRVLNCFRSRGFSEVRFRTGQVSSWGPSSFFTKRLLDAVGGVDERCQYTMDGDLWLKFAAIAGARYRPFVKYAWGLRLHENGKMSGHNFASSAHQSPDHPKWAQIRKEGELRKEYFTPTAKRNRWNWLRSIHWPEVIMSRFDTMRYKGRHYLDA